jgi:ribonuclease M5
MEKLKIQEAIVVEGRDDTAVLKQVTDALIIETHGFGIAKTTWELLEKAYKEKGLIILTDPDFSGEEIRKKIVKNFPESKHAYMPRKKATKKALEEQITASQYQELDNMLVNRKRNVR